MRVAAAAACTLAVLLAGCATPEPLPPAVVVVPPPPAAEPPLQNQPLKHLANRKLAPIPTRPLNVKTRCTFREPTGYRGRLDIQVKEADVKRLLAEVTIPKRGTCRFDLKDFQQSETLPTVTLKTTGNACAVRVWEQTGRVTVAFRDCQAQCSGESFDYLWPILVEAKTGRCS